MPSGTPSITSSTCMTLRREGGRVFGISRARRQAGDLRTFILIRSSSGLPFARDARNGWKPMGQISSVKDAVMLPNVGSTILFYWGNALVRAKVLEIEAP